MRAEQNKLRLLKAPAIIVKLAARPELQKNNTIKLRTFVVERDGDFDVPFISYRHVSQEERPPHGLQLPCKTRMDIHHLEKSLTQEQIFQELVSNSFCSFLLLGYMAHRSPRFGYAIPNTDVSTVDFFQGSNSFGQVDNCWSLYGCLS